MWDIFESKIQSNTSEACMPMPSAALQIMTQLGAAEEIPWKGFDKSRMVKLNRKRR